MHIDNLIVSIYFSGSKFIAFYLCYTDLSDSLTIRRIIKNVYHSFKNVKLKYKNNVMIGGINCLRFQYFHFDYTMESKCKTIYSHTSPREKYEEPVVVSRKIWRRRVNENDTYYWKLNCIGY